jgi:hypothetical protein
VYAKLPPYPMYPADAVPLPKLDWPKVAPLKLEEVAPPKLLEVPPLRLAAVTPHGPILNNLRDAVGHAYRAVDDAVEDAVGDVLRRRTQDLREEAERDAATGGLNPSP